MLAPSAPSPSSFGRALIARLPFAGLLSFRYLLLRGWTAGGGLLAGLVQTFVFARVLDPDRFSLFILVGALGVSMWLFDLGLSKILFVQLRKLFLAGEETLAVGAQANAVVIFYTVLITAASVICAALFSLRPGVSPWQAAELGLFFFFSAFNLTWFVLRNASLAVDEYIYFETLESCRRVVYIGLMLALLAGLPFSAFVILINLSWAVLIVLAGGRLVRRRALAPRFGGSIADLHGFFRDNRAAALRTGTHAAGEVYLHGVLYLAVPFAFGLGAPTIIVDTALKIFLGTLNLCTAACDLLVPRQTAAYSARDRRMLIRTTLAALALCAFPALAIAALLLLDAPGLFALLLGHAAVMPASITPILVVLLAAGVLKTAPAFLLQYTGHFRETARLSIINSLLMTAGIWIGLIAHLNVVGLLTVYTGVFVAAGLLYFAAAVRGPIRAAR
jgi:O-antigen/teichoic acid export membrane protein